jgi:uncharacterized coiled-coil DUF342 family protein
MNRYIKSLEDQIAHLKTELARLNKRIDELVSQLAQNPQPEQPRPQPSPRPRDRRPETSNFLRSRERLERATLSGLAVAELTAEDLKLLQDEGER